MSERTTVKRGGRNKKLSWYIGIRDEEERVYFTCRCGASGPLTDHHIGPNGEVTPSVHHDHEDCGFHSDITLEGYTDNGT